MRVLIVVYFYCTLLYVHSSIEIILIGKRELVALLDLSSWCLVVVVWIFLAVPWVCLRFVIVVFPGPTSNRTKVSTIVLCNRCARTFTSEQLQLEL